MAKGVEDTAFYRYGRLLALNEVGGDPGRFGIERRATSTRPCLERARALPAEPADHADPRRQALGRRPRADRRAGLDRRRSGRQPSSGWFELTESLRDGRRARRRRALLPVPDAGRRLADRARAHAGVHGEGAARGQAQHQLDRAEPRVGGGGQALLRARCTTHRAFLDDFEPFARRVAAARRARRARPARAQADRARASPTSTRATSSRSARSSTPTTAARSTGTGARRCCARLMGGSPPVRETRKLFLILRLLALRARRPEPFATGAYEPVDAGERVCAFLAAARCSSRSASRDGAAEGVSRAPEGRWRDVLRGESGRSAAASGRRRARRARHRRVRAPGAVGPNAVSAHRGATGPCAAR